MLINNIIFVIKYKLVVVVKYFFLVVKNSVIVKKVSEINNIMVNRLVMFCNSLNVFFKDKDGWLIVSDW